jgi:hypothetical protein
VVRCYNVMTKPKMPFPETAAACKLHHHTLRQSSRKVQSHLTLIVHYIDAHYRIPISLCYDPSTTVVILTAKSRRVVTLRSPHEKDPASSIYPPSWSTLSTATPTTPPLPGTGSAIVSVCSLTRQCYKLRTGRCWDGCFGGLSFDLWSGRSSILRMIWISWYAW